MTETEAKQFIKRETRKALIRIIAPLVAFLGIGNIWGISELWDLAKEKTDTLREIREIVDSEEGVAPGIIDALTILKADPGLVEFINQSKDLEDLKILQASLRSESRKCDVPMRSWLHWIINEKKFPEGDDLEKALEQLTPTNAPWPESKR